MCRTKPILVPPNISRSLASIIKPHGTHSTSTTNLRVCSLKFGRNMPKSKRTSDSMEAPSFQEGGIYKRF